MIGIQEIGIFATIFVFFLLIILHELGHFFAARAVKTHVEEFGIGIPPKIKTLFRDQHGTRFTLNAVPLGGFVKLQGDNPHEENAFDNEYSFHSRSRWQKIFILSGGVFVNIVTGRIILFACFFIGVQPFIVPDQAIPFEINSNVIVTPSLLEERGNLVFNDANSPVIVASVVSGSAADGLDLRIGDTITAINQESVTVASLSSTLEENIGQNISLRINRDDETKIIPYTCPEDSCILGISIQRDVEVSFPDQTILSAAGLATNEVRAQAILTVRGLSSLFSGLFSADNETRREAIEQISGPVGQVKVGGIIANNVGRGGFAFFVALLSLALAFFNILPIPALDGGRIFSVLLHLVTPIDAASFFRIESYLNALVFFLLMLLGIVIIIKDINVFWL